MDFETGTDPSYVPRWQWIFYVPITACELENEKLSTKLNYQWEFVEKNALVFAKRHLSVMSTNHNYDEPRGQDKYRAREYVHDGFNV